MSSQYSFAIRLTDNPDEIDCRVNKMNNVILIGFMGSGKSSVGKALAKKLERKFIDMDDEIELGEEKSINDIFTEYGEDHFRELETNYLEKLLTKKNKVISTGGGVILKEENIAILKRIGTVVFLHTTYEALLKNLEGDKKSYQKPMQIS